MTALPAVFVGRRDVARGDELILEPDWEFVDNEEHEPRRGGKWHRFKAKFKNRTTRARAAFRRSMMAAANSSLHVSRRINFSWLKWVIVAAILAVATLKMLPRVHFGSDKKETAAETNVSRKEAAARTAQEPVHQFVPAFPRDTSFVVVARKDWSPPVELPRGMAVDWMPEDAVTYELRAANGNVTTFPAETHPVISVKDPLNRMQFRAIDADSVVIRVSAYVPR